MSAGDHKLQRRQKGLVPDDGGLIVFARCLGEPPKVSDGESQNEPLNGEMVNPLGCSAQ